MNPDSNSSSELRATRMELSIDPAVDRSSSGGFEIDEEQIERAQALLTEHGFHIASDSYQHTILTVAFATTDEKIKNINQIVEKLREWYTSEKIHYSAEARPQQDYNDEIFRSVVSVYVEGTE